jgi:hypothetical protein
MKKHIETIMILLFIGVILVSVVYAATRTWTGGGDGSKWSVAANWGGTALQSGDTVIINTDTSTVCDTNITLNTCDYAGLNKTSTVSVTGTLTADFFYVGEAVSTKHSLKYTGGNTIIKSRFYVGGGNSSTINKGDGDIEISGGSIIINNDFRIGVGRGSDGVVVITNNAAVTATVELALLATSDSTVTTAIYRNYSEKTAFFATNLYVGYQRGTCTFENTAGISGALTNYIGFTTGAVGYQIHKGGQFYCNTLYLSTANAVSGNLNMDGGTYTVSNSYSVIAGEGTINFSDGTLILPNSYGDPTTNAWFIYDGDTAVNSSYDGTYWTITSVPKAVVPVSDYNQRVPLHPANRQRVTNWAEGRR